MTTAMPLPFHERDLLLPPQKGLEQKKKKNMRESFNSCFAMLIVSGYHSEVPGSMEYMSKKIIFVH